MRRFIFLFFLLSISGTKCFSQGYFGIYYYYQSSQSEDLKETNGRINFGESNFGTEEEPENVGTIYVRDVDDESGVIDQQFFFGQNASYSYKKDGYLMYEDLYCEESVRIYCDSSRKNYVQIQHTREVKNNQIDKHPFIVISFFDEGDETSFMMMDLWFYKKNKDLYSTIWNFIKRYNIKETSWD